MPISGLAKIYIDKAFDFKVVEGDGGPRIGRNVAFVKLKRAVDKFRPSLERYETDLAAINADRNLSNEGRWNKHAELTSKNNQESSALAAEVQEQIAALRAESDGIRSRVRGKFVPQDAGERMEASETRALLRAMPAEKRSALLIQAAQARDPQILKALATVPAWDQTIIATDVTRNMIADAINAAELEALEPTERAAVENAAACIELAERKLKSFTDESRRMKEANQTGSALVGVTQ